MINLQVLFFSIILPLVLIPIEHFLPYPYFIEEIFKFFILINLFLSKKTKIIYPILIGFLFNLTETILYIPNLIRIGNPNLLITRLFFTGSMHILTTVLMYLGLKKNKYIGILNLVISITIHYFFNYFCLLKNN